MVTPKRVIPLYIRIEVTIDIRIDVSKIQALYLHAMQGNIPILVSVIYFCVFLFL